MCKILKSDINTISIHLQILKSLSILFQFTNILDYSLSLYETTRYTLGISNITISTSYYDVRFTRYRRTDLNR